MCAAVTKYLKLGNLQTTFVPPSSGPYKSNIKTQSGSISGEGFSLLPVLCLAAGMSRREMSCLHRVRGIGISDFKYLTRNLKFILTYNLKEMYSIMAAGGERTAARTGGIVGNRQGTGSGTRLPPARLRPLRVPQPFQTAHESTGTVHMQTVTEEKGRK